MNTEIAVSLLYPSVHLLLRTSKLAPVWRRNLLTWSIHADNIRLFLCTDSMSSPAARRAVRQANTEAKRRKKTKQKYQLRPPPPLLLCGEIKPAPLARSLRILACLRLLLISQKNGQGSRAERRRVREPRGFLKGAVSGRHARRVTAARWRPLSRRDELWNTWVNNPG